jgi:hypothetical protein
MALEQAFKLVEDANTKIQDQRYDTIRRYCELVKQKAIQAPPDQPPLQTVPWNIGHPPTTLPNKSELTKRTEGSVATIQKNK